MSQYDSYKDTMNHINRVRDLLFIVCKNFYSRATAHDQTKLREPEKSIFDIATPKLRSLTYGTEEYKEALVEIKEALDHHYQYNSHHPEHYVNGIDGMSLFDIFEMLVDWKAAGERHEDGCINKSLEINKQRFNISPQLYNILTNTVKELGWEK